MLRAKEKLLAGLLDQYGLEEEPQWGHPTQTITEDILHRAEPLLDEEEGDRLKSKRNLLQEALLVMKLVQSDG
jgi:hypothetical protein